MVGKRKTKHLKIISRYNILPMRNPVKRKVVWKLTVTRTWCRRFVCYCRVALNYKRGGGEVVLE